MLETSRKVQLYSLKIEQLNKWKYKKEIARLFAVLKNYPKISIKIFLAIIICSKVSLKTFLEWERWKTRCSLNYLQSWELFRSHDDTARAVWWTVGAWWGHRYCRQAGDCFRLNVECYLKLLGLLLEPLHELGVEAGVDQDPVGGGTGTVQYSTVQYSTV